MGRIRVPPPPCSIAGCDKPAREFNRTLCRTHGKRQRIHGDPNYVTPESVRVQRHREALLSSKGPIKPSTYKKFFGRHEHRAIAEKMLGRKLRSDEHVHHIDENKHNNHPSNLQVMTRQEHLAHHARTRQC